MMPVMPTMSLAVGGQLADEPVPRGEVEHGAGAAMLRCSSIRFQLRWNIRSEKGPHRERTRCR